MSPYENRLQGENFRRVGLIALVRQGGEAALSDRMKKAPANLSTRLAALRISNVNVFMKTIGEQTYLFTFLEYQGTAVAEVESIPSMLGGDEWFATLSEHLEAHPRAAAAGRLWLRMEFMNAIGPTLPLPAGARPLARLGLMSSLKPECELTYRTLHQTNWPGVIDQMGRSHYRYWISFMVEFGNGLLLFTYCEYVGTDKATDDAAMAADPVTQRWWTHTEPCLKPLVPGNGSWTPMSLLLETDKPCRGWPESHR